MCKGNRIGHQFLGFVCGITEHHTLIACTDGFDLFVTHAFFSGFQCTVNAHGNIRGLLVNGYHNRTGIGIKSDFAAIITDFIHGFTNDSLDIQLCLRGNLTGYQNKAGTAAGFACHTASRILLHAGIQNSIGNGIADFVGMSFRYRF